MALRKFIVATVLLCLLSWGIHEIFIPLTPTDWDEYVYVSAAQGIERTGFPSLVTNPGDEDMPFFYQPPLHFFIMSATETLTIESARQLSALIAALSVLAIIFATNSITQSRSTALLAGLLLATDGWFTYSSGLVKLDTAALTIGLFGIGVFAQSLRSGSLKATVIAGLLLGLSSDYKHIAVFALIAIAIHWIVTRKNHKEHGVTILVGSLCLFLYADFMALYIGKPYVDANLVQIRRSLGFQSARGLDADWGTILKALFQTYFVFGGSLVVIAVGLLASIGDTIMRLWTSLYEGDVIPRISRLASSYMWAACMILLALKLKNPHYVVILIATATICVASILISWIRSSKRLHTIANVIIIVILALNVVTLIVRATYFSGFDAMQEARYVVEHLPVDAVILSEEPICQMKLVTQTCIKLDLYASVKNTAPPVQYVILILTTTQKPPPQYDVQKLIAESTTERDFGDWKNHIVILRTLNN